MAGQSGGGAGPQLVRFQFASFQSCCMTEGQNSEPRMLHDAKTELRIPQMVEQASAETTSSLPVPFASS
jgi:hypothetical protein